MEYIWTVIVENAPALGVVLSVIAGIWAIYIHITKKKAAEQCSKHKNIVGDNNSGTVIQSGRDAQTSISGDEK